MGTTDRSIDKQSGKIPPSVTEKAKKQSRIPDLRSMMKMLGFNYYRVGKGEKKYENLNTSKPKYKKRKRRLQKQGHKASRK